MAVVWIRGIRRRYGIDMSRLEEIGEELKELEKEHALLMRKRRLLINEAKEIIATQTRLQVGSLSLRLTKTDREELWTSTLQIERSEASENLISTMDLNKEDIKLVNSIYVAMRNLGDYKDFLPHLKGKKGRRQLYEAIREDISQYIEKHGMA